MSFCISLLPVSLSCDLTCAFIYSVWFLESHRCQTTDFWFLETYDVLLHKQGNSLFALPWCLVSKQQHLVQAVVFVDDGRAPCLINSSAAKLLGLPRAGEMDPIEVAGGMRRLADRSEIRANAYR